MGLNDAVLNQTCLYWEPRTEQDRHGNTQYKDAVELRCRWDEDRSNGFDAKGKEVTFNSVVMTDTDIVPDGMIMLGVLDDLDNSTIPPPEADRVLRHERVPDFNNEEIFHFSHL